METQEQILKEQRLRIEVLRHQLLLRYYELLLSLDVLAQAAEVKTLMGYINTLERYAKRFENTPSKPIKIRHISKTTRPDKFKTASKKNPYPKIYTILPGSTKNLNMAS